MVQVVIRALNILKFVAQHGKEPVQLYKIAEHVGLGQATTVNIIQSMVQKNYLENVGRKKGYRLGIAAFQLTNHHSYNQSISIVTKEFLEDLTWQLNETSLIAVINNSNQGDTTPGGR